MQRLIAYLQLVRLPTVFTAMADIFLGYAFTHDLLEPTFEFFMLLLTSSCLYLSGMVFNDVFDRNIDAQQRPNRPIPSGRVSLLGAVRLGSLLVVIGLAAAQLAGRNCLTTAVVLTLLILAYDGPLKRTPIGPVAMGACRFLNVLLGASALENAASVWSKPQLEVAIALGVYITGVTWFARKEATQSSRRHLLMATFCINLGLAGLFGFVVGWDGSERLTVLAVLGVIALTINRRLISAVLDPIPERVQPAVRTLLLSIVMLDATLILFQTGNPIEASLAAALVVPAIVFGLWIPVT